MLWLTSSILIFSFSTLCFHLSPFYNLTVLAKNVTALVRYPFTTTKTEAVCLSEMSVNFTLSCVDTRYRLRTTGFTVFILVTS
jgi:hypothetical protein